MNFSAQEARHAGRLLALVVGLLLWSGAVYASPIFAGSWYVGDGPIYTDNPQVLNAREAAAVLFGGAPDDYVISTISNRPEDINFKAFVDGWGDDTFLTVPVSQDFKLDQDGAGYDAPGGLRSAFSAFVLDHSCFNRYYSDINEPCLDTQIGLNYAFRVSDSGGNGTEVPEPATLSLLGTGLAAFVVRRRARRDHR
jgi:PEP-CTERM motif